MHYTNAAVKYIILYFLFYGSNISNLGGKNPQTWVSNSDTLISLSVVSIKY